jgi:aspartyl-tRNA(Asn)/glutamyl-tRNA(Gln) amidotransferase subunit C
VTDTSIRRARGRSRIGDPWRVEILTRAARVLLRMTSGDADDTAGDTPVDAETVEHVAAMARIDLTPAEVDRYAAEFADVLDYFAALDDVPDVDDESALTNVLRTDEMRESLDRDAALRNAPETEDGHVKGPHV